MRILFPVWLATLAACATTQPTPAAPSAPVAAAAKPAKPERFEFKVRQDFFDGMRGDAAALDRAQKVCEDTLAKNPNHAEAMVWHGAMLTARAQQAFAKGDRSTGMELYQKGTGEMDHAVELAPTDPGVRIPRGALYLGMAHFVPQPEQTKIVKEGVEDYEVTLEVQKAFFKTLTLHSREQLLYGLTDGYAMLGNTDKARETYERMRSDAPTSELLTRAAERAAGHEVKGNTPCEQCHSR